MSLFRGESVWPVVNHFQPTVPPTNPANGDMWYDNAANTFLGRINGVTVSLSPSSIAPTPGTTFTVASQCNSLPNCFSAKVDAQATPNASYTSGSSVVTTGANDPPFCNGTTLPCTPAQIAVGHTTDVGMIAFANGNCNPSNEMACTYDCHQTTIAAVNSAHSVTLSSPCTNSSSATARANNFVWGSDDSTALTAAWTAAMNNTAFTGAANVQLPCGKMLMGTQSFVFLPASFQQFSMGMSGCGEGNPTEIIPLPKMSCTGFLGIGGCLLNSVFGQDAVGNLSFNNSFRNILFNGYGLPDADSAATFTPGVNGIKANFFTNLFNVGVQGWLWNRLVTTPVYGLYCAGCFGYGVNIYAGGNLGVSLNGILGVPGSLYGGSVGGSIGPSLDIGLGQTSTFGVYINQNESGAFTLAKGYGIRNIQSGSNYSDFGSNITTGIWTDVGAKSSLFGSTLTGSGTTYSYYLNGGTLSLSNVSIVSHAHIVSGTLQDLGGNTPPSTYGGYDALTGTIQADGHSLKGTCTGTASPSSTLGLYGTGPNATTTTCTSTTIGSGIPMTGARTISTLLVTASAGGVSGASGVVTVLKNGSPTALTCTLGTTTTCFDGTHSVAAVDGDLISIQFTTQGAETLANVKAFVQWN